MTVEDLLLSVILRKNGNKEAGSLDLSDNRATSTTPGNTSSESGVIGEDGNVSNTVFGRLAKVLYDDKLTCSAYLMSPPATPCSNSAIGAFANLNSNTYPPSSPMATGVSSIQVHEAAPIKSKSQPSSSLSQSSEKLQSTSTKKGVRGLLLKKHISNDLAMNKRPSDLNSTLISNAQDEDYESSYIKSTPSFKSDSVLYNAMGFAAASVFSLAYYLAPLYMIGIIGLFPFMLRSIYYWIYVLIFAVTCAIPPIKSEYLLSTMFFKSMLSYFDYEVIQEARPDDIETLDFARSYIFSHHPHAVLSYGALCYGILLAPHYIPETAVASVVLQIPFIKHSVGLYGMIPVSKPSLVKHLKTNPMTIYPGGIAELFLSSTRKEKLFLKNRKGFIKLALQTGSDVIPSYHFGNTMTLKIIKTEFLQRVSRLLGATITLAAGRWNLPLPMKTKLLTVTGRPLGLPKTLRDPTQEDVDYWHDLYIKDVTRIFDKYKHRLEDYKDKDLIVL